MSDQTKYPARGEMSADGKLYTGKNGSVYASTFDGTSDNCTLCDVTECEGEIACATSYNLKRIEGAYVPSTDEQAACDMARAMIVVCGALYSENYDHCGACNGCFRLEEKSCPARSYLAAHGDASAWEVK